MAVLGGETKANGAQSAAVDIRIERASVSLGERPALTDISCVIASGSFVGLIGPNGSGKSTLLRAILGITRLASGRIEIGGVQPAEAREQFAYLPQRKDLELDLPLRALDVVLMGRLRPGAWLRSPSKLDKEMAESALKRVGLAASRRSPIGELSFGQQQRVLFARTLAQEGSIVLLDEPMTGVDPQTQDVFLEILGSMRDEGRTVIMATHDLNQAAANCDTVCVLNQRLVAFGPLRETLTESVLSDAYGTHLHLMHGEEHMDHILEDVHHHETRD